MARCDPCDRWFVDVFAFQQHRESSSAHHHVCDVCYKVFQLEESLNQHKDSVGHDRRSPSCHLCSKLFGSQTALEQHLDSPKHTISCDYCYNKRFHTEQQLYNHYTTDHGYCDKCKRQFKDDQALQNHLDNSSKHIDEFRCIECDRSFVSSRALEDHLRDKVHAPRPTLVVKDNYCDDCNKLFRSRQAYEQHRASLRHNPISEHLECPFGCKNEFLAPSALVHHLESGGCESKMTKQRIDEMAYTTDTAGIITNPVIAGVPQFAHSWDVDARSEVSSETNSNTEVSDDAGSSMFSSVKNTTIVAIKPENTDLIILSSLLEDCAPLHCPLCPDRGPFIDERALKQHLASPAAHSPKLYHCPIMLPGLASNGHRKGFTTLSGLAQHIEARACNGGKKTLRLALGEVMEVLRRTGWGFVKLVG